MSYQHNGPLKNSPLVRKDIARCSACLKQCSLEEYAIDKICPNCDTEMFIVVDKKCMGCEKVFVSRSTDNYRFCRDCKAAWVDQY